MATATFALAASPRVVISTKPVSAQPAAAPRVLNPYSRPTSLPMRSERCTKKRDRVGRVAPMAMVGGSSSRQPRAKRTRVWAKKPTSATSWTRWYSPLTPSSAAGKASPQAAMSSSSPA